MGEDVSPCQVIDVPGGQAIVCSRGETKRCSCGNRMTKLCDWPLTGGKAGKTCDRPMCDKCATRVGPNRDFCPAHARMADEVPK